MGSGPIEEGRCDQCGDWMEECKECGCRWCVDCEETKCPVCGPVAVEGE